MTRTMKVAVALVAGALLGMTTSFVTADALGGDSPQSRSTVHTQTALTQISFRVLQSFTEFPVYGLPAEFKGLRLLSSKRISPEVLDEVARLDPPLETVGTPENSPESRGHRIRPDFVSMAYGTCVGQGSDANTLCTSPIRIQVWEACNRSIDDYELAPGVEYPRREVSLRGTTAADFGDRLEIYAGSVTIVIFAETDLAIEAANALIPLNDLATQEMPTSGGLPASKPGPECA